MGGAGIALLRVGTAAWAIPRELATRFAAPQDGSQLQRYARVMNCVEINSSFYRSHRPETYQRWAAETPEGFRFAVKLPKSVTHQARLVAADCREPLLQFLAESAGLGEKRGVLLMQLPPSLAFKDTVAARFFESLLRRHFDGPVVIEPRHPTWFTAQADRWLVKARVSRVGADPVPRDVDAESGSLPAGWLDDGAIRYHRWHGSPRMYWSDYADEWLRQRLALVARTTPAGAAVWCVFDNTASGRALPNAWAARAMILGG